MDLLGYAIKSWSDKKSVEQPHKDNISWSSATALPSLSTTLPRPRYPNSAIQSELPNFQTSVSCFVNISCLTFDFLST